ncbi:MAG: methyltransferase domain-containing protein [Clostridiales bacterium]|nr:methyltransferase domain-containing protein [Clostridiales bacterium]
MENTSALNQPDVVKSQYQSSANLSTRISIHDKYSTNKMGFGNWIFSNYEIRPGASVLELGCGTGSMWVGKDDAVSKCGQLVLSDFSEGMLDTAKEKLAKFVKIEYKVIDIEAIPFEKDSFDVVIANMMLYHVPNLLKGLREVSRVLKDTGVFYCATYGEHGIMEHLSNIFSEYGVEDTTNKNFTLQNGYDSLEKVFRFVKRRDYKDSLAVTSLKDMIDYILSFASMSDLHKIPEQKLEETLRKHMVNGILPIPKEYGMFICRK